MTLRMPNNQTRGVKTIHRVIDLLEAFQNYPTGLTLSELSSYLKIPKSTVFRLLNALMERQFVRESNPPGRFLLGSEILRLSLAYHKGFNLYREVHPVLEEIHNQTGDTVILGVLDQTGHQIIYLDKIDSSKSIKFGSHMGETAPIHCTALGKALLAGFRDDELLRILTNYELKPYTTQTIVSLGDLLEELRRVRERGYAVDCQEYKQQVICVAAAIFNYLGEPQAAITVSAQANRLESPRLEAVAQMIVVSAQEISKLLAYTPVVETSQGGERR